MKRWFTKSLLVSFIAVFVLALIPSASAAGEIGTVFGETSWLINCGDAMFGGVVPIGVAMVDNVDRIPPEFVQINSFYAWSAEFGAMEEVTTTEFGSFVDAEGYWWFIVPADGYTTMVIEVKDNGGLLHTVATVTADCTAGTINAANSGVYGPKVPKGFELRSLSCSSAVLDTPAGKQVGSNAVLAGQSWFVNPKSVAGADGQNYTEIFVGGWKNGYIPSVCIGGVPSFSAE